MRLVSLVILGGFTFATLATAGENPARIPRLLRELEKKYLKSESLHAGFEQVQWIDALKRKKISSGEIWVQIPNRFRWQTLKPDPNLLVTDGTEYWFYTPPFRQGEQGQLMTRKAAQASSRLATALLGGRFTQLNGRFEKMTEDQFDFTPKKGTSGDVEKINLKIDLKLNVIKSVALTHQGGNKSTIVLKDIKLGEKLDASFFTFKTPPGTQIINE